MTKRVDLYSSYGSFKEQVLEAIRKETFGEDIGQNSWTTIEEYGRFIEWLRITSEDHVLEVASGSGGPARYVANRVKCRVTGIDQNKDAVATATQAAEGLTQLIFKVVDANSTLPFGDDSFDGIICVDAMNHFENRMGVLQEWRRVLRAGRRALFTDPVVITGPITNDEIALRSSIGLFLFVPPGVNELLIEQSGLHLVHQENVTENASLISSRWHGARQRYRDALVQMEGEQRFEDLQKFFASVHRLTSERRLSRIVYVVEK